MIKANKWLLTGIAAAAAAIAAAGAAMLLHSDRSVPELTEESFPAYEVQAAELQAEAPAVSGTAPVLPDPELLPETGYLLKLRGNVLSVYEDGVREPIAEYDLPAGWLPDYDRILLEYGIRVSGKDELRELIEDYVS